MVWELGDFLQRSDMTHINFMLRVPRIISRLHPNPNLRSVPEQPTEQDCDLGRNRLLLSHDRMKTLAGNAEQVSNLTHRAANSGDDILAQQSARMRRTAVRIALSSIRHIIIH